MVESFLRMTQILEYIENFPSSFIILGSFLYNFLATFLHKMVLKTQQVLIQIFPVENFEEITAFFGTGLKTPENPYETTKKHVLWQAKPNFCSNNETFWRIEFPMTLALNNKVFKTQMGKKWHEVHRVYNKGVKVSELSSFSTT